MNTQSTLDALQQMRLHGMANRYQSIIDLPTHQQPDSMHQLVAILAQSEQEYRRDHRTLRNLKRSKLRYDATMEEIICTKERNLTKDVIIQLSDCSFIKKSESILIVGASGTGKSWLACAIGRMACTKGYEVLYLRMNKLIGELKEAKLDGSLAKRLRAIERTQVLILDDFALQKLDSDTRLILMDILEDRYNKGATIVTSQLPVANWYETIGENPTVADAIMDRLTANSHRIELKGKSLRKKNQQGK